jgi:hypothetical protein
MLSLMVEMLSVCSSHRLRRRNFMLDLIVVVVTIVSFLVLISFTEACEHL